MSSNKKDVPVVIYTKGYCPYCDRAKALLDKKGIAYQEVAMDNATPEELSTMIEKSEGRRTVPQIFIREKPIGGFDDLYALQKSGQLNDLLAE